jgi:iron complex transport system substrate-binding protein
MSMPPRWRGALPLLAALSLLFAGCGSGSSKATNASPASPTTATSAAGPGAAIFPVTVASAQGPVAIKARPVAIVSLSPTATENLFAIGAGHQVVAVDDQSDYPPEAPRTTLSGYQPNVEAIAAKKPDLVVIADDSGGLSAQLAKIDIPVLVDPPATNLNDADAQIVQLGTATGHPADAAHLVASMRASIDQVVRSTPHRTPPLRVYHELDQTLYTATSSTFIGQLYRLLGANNIADAADTTGSGYPQLSAEYVVKADPQVIFLADTKCCHQDLATVAARPAWSGITAVRDGAVINLDDDIASRWGPRVIDLVRLIARGLSQAHDPGGAG